MSEATKRPKAKQRVRSPHPGVVLLKPDPATRHGWRARFVDVDTGKTVKVPLDDTCSNAAQRRDWAVNKSKSLAKRRMELESGAIRATGREIKDVLAEYFAHNTQLAERSLGINRVAADKLIAFAKDEKIRTADELTRPVLLRFRAMLINERKRVPKIGGKRGEWVDSKDKRSAPSVNQDLIGIRTVLGYCADLDQFSKLTHDDLRRALKRLKVAEEHNEFLRPPEIVELLKATLKHDAETFAVTRSEHAGNARLGTTPRFEPIAPFIAFLVLSGCRRGEALALDWRDVDLAVGELRIQGTATKTRLKRFVGLEVSPSLRLLLALLHERAGRPSHGRVFDLTATSVEAAVERLQGRKYGAPDFSPQLLRATCASLLVNAPGIYIGASAYHEAKRLGHSVAVAEKHYVGLIRNLPVNATTLEAATGIIPQMIEIVSRLA